jgi:spore coat polysaccharide biosynthesis protein SpsF (cytidylyltransferase family)
MKLAIFVQARLTSKRFPRKILSKITNKTIIEIILNKLNKIKPSNKIFVLIPNTKLNDRLEKYIRKLNFPVFRGSEQNVLDRYYKAAKKFNVYNIVRITSDCPLIDIKIVNKIIKKFLSGRYDYGSNTFPPTFPDGMDVEIFKFSTLEKAWKDSKSSFDKEHVTPYMRRTNKKILNIKSNYNLKNVRLTLDTKKDLILIKKIFQYFKPNILFGLNDIIKLRKKFPKWFSLRSKRNKLGFYN